MQSILGALLTAGYAAALATAIAAAPNVARRSPTATQDQLQQSFAGAESVASSSRSTRARSSPPRSRRSSTVPNWAYIAGIVAVLVGATLVFFMFPKQDEEEALLRQYHDTDFADSE